MNRLIMIGLSMLAGATLGVGASATLRAQAEPPGYVLAESNVTNPDGFKNEFLPLIGKAILDNGGKYLSRGGRTIAVEGSPPAPRVTLIQFDSLEKARAFLDSKPRKDAQAVGNKYAMFRVFAVEGVVP